MQKPKLRPILFAIVWGNPYTHPPEGMPRELIAMTRMQESTRDIPPEILQALETVAKPGSGWAPSGLVPMIWINSKYLSSVACAPGVLNSTATAIGISFRLPLTREQA